MEQKRVKKGHDVILPFRANNLRYKTLLDESLGTITIYSHLQAAGIINDHDKNCPRYNYINSKFKHQLNC